MRYFLDTEFLEYPGHLELISLALVAEDGRECYLVNSEFSWDDADHPEGSLDWLRQHVQPRLYRPDLPSSTIRPENFAALILNFIEPDREPEFWGWYAAYDWVAFCWLFGRMVNLPDQFPQHCLDLRQLYERPIPDLPAADAHNAMLDARWLRDAYNHIFHPPDCSLPF